MAINFPDSPSLNDVFTENEKTFIWDGVAWNVVDVEYKENILINGNFDVWQRGVSGNYGYLADRWRVLGSDLFEVTQQRTAFLIGQTDVPNNPTFHHRATVTSITGTTNYKFLRYSTEGVENYSGETLTLSFWAKANATRNLSVEFVQYFGTGGTPSAEVNGIGVKKVTLSTSWQKFTITVTLPSVTGKTIGSDNNDYLGILFWYDAGSAFNSRTDSLGHQSGTFDIAQVKLERNEYASEFRKRSYANELSLCKRYYQKVFLGRFTGITYTPNGDTRFSIPIENQMRVNPSVTVFNNNTNVIAFGSAGNIINETLGNLTFTATNDLLRLTQIGNASAFTSAGSVIAWGDNSNSVELRLDAEL